MVESSRCDWNHGTKPRIRGSLQGVHPKQLPGRVVNVQAFRSYQKPLQHAIEVSGSTRAEGAGREALQLSTCRISTRPGDILPQRAHRGLRSFFRFYVVPGAQSNHHGSGFVLCHLTCHIIALARRSVAL